MAPFEVKTDALVRADIRLGSDFTGCVFDPVCPTDEYDHVGN
jgi:hypothetical protein